MKDTYLFNLTLKTFLLTMDKEHEYLFYIVDKGDRIFDNKKEQELIIRFNIAFKNVEFIFYPITNVEKGHVTKMWNIIFKDAYDKIVNIFINVYVCSLLPKDG